MSPEPLHLPLPALPPATRRVWVACSGGMDSLALLQALRQHRCPDLAVVHVHHGLQPAADGWARQLRAQCRRWALPFRLLRVQVDPQHPQGPEAAARAARYAALSALLRPGDLLATAHHLDDQAETVLLRLLRGTGLTGLAAMAPLGPLGRGQLWRPLLAVPRAQLRAYAQAHDLRWVEDPHNQDLRYARSYLRQEILPRLAPHWPQAAQNLARAAALAAEAQELLTAQASQDLQAHADAPAALSVRALLDLPPPRRHQLLRHWLRQRQLEAPSAAQLARLDTEVLAARPDAAPALRCGSQEFRRYRDRLLVMPALAPAPGAERLRWGRGALVLPSGCGVLKRSGRLRAGLEVGFPRGGERLRLEAGGPTRTLKNLFQEAGVPPWVRQRTPLVYRGDTLLAVGDLWRSAEACALGLNLIWEHEWPDFVAAPVS